MTTIDVDTEKLGSALAALWRRHRGTNLARIALVEETAAKVVRGTADGEELVAAAAAAHKLAGALGTFGFDDGSRAALEAESLLRAEEIDGRLLAEAVTLLRAAVEKRTQTIAEVPQADEPATQPDEPTASTSVQVISADADLVGRLIAAGAAAGIAISVDAAPRGHGSGPVAVILDAAPVDGIDQVERLSHLSARGTPVIVLTGDDSFDARITLSRAGAFAVIHRSHAARLAIGHVATTLAERQAADWDICVLHQDPAFVEMLSETLPGPRYRFNRYDDAAELWLAIESNGADLVLIDGEYSAVSIPDLCRVVRAHPERRLLPLIAYGPRRSGEVREAMLAGLDDYLSLQLPRTELACRLQAFLQRSRYALARSDRDAVTGVENRSATERSLDRGLRTAARQSQAFSFARVAIDGLADIAETEGQVVADLLLRRLAGHLTDSFRDEDVVGRWGDGEFVVGMYGTARADAALRLERVLDQMPSGRVPTTSGRTVHGEPRYGVAAFPEDGTTLTSLERASESQLERERVGARGLDLPAAEASSSVDVVIIEDDDSIADVIDYALELRGYSSCRFSDGAEAASELSSGSVRGRTILLDVGLPSLDGFGVLHQLGAAGVLASSHLIMLTARSSEAERLRALGLGATEHITKPFSVPLLLGRLDQLLVRSES